MREKGTEENFHKSENFPPSLFLIGRTISKLGMKAYLNLKDEFTNLKSDIEKKQVLIKKGISIQEANKIVKEEKAKRKEENQDIVNRLDRKTIQEYGNKNFIVSASNFASDMTMAILGANGMTNAGINPIVSNALAQGAKGFAEATASTTNKKDIAVDTISSGAWGAIFNGANNLLGKTGLGKVSTNKLANFGKFFLKNAISSAVASRTTQSLDIFKSNPNYDYIDWQQVEKGIQSGKYKNIEEFLDSNDYISMVTKNRASQIIMSSIITAFINTFVEYGKNPSIQQIQRQDDAYKTLGLSRNASDEEIRSTYRKLAKLYHPDNSTTGNTEMFTKINEAYHTIIDSRIMSQNIQTTQPSNASQNTDSSLMNLPQGDISYLYQKYNIPKINTDIQLPQNTQNTSNNVQNVANIEQISQKNVQNVSDLEKNQQMSISDEQNNQATVTNEIQTFVENRNKIAPGLNVEMDNTLKTDGVIIKNSDGTRTMKINPNSTRAYEFVAVHEMLHDLEGTQEYSELQKYVQDRATSHENYEQAKQKITEQYENFYKNNNLDMSNLDMNVETVNDMVAQSLGNQQFLNELAGNKPNVFMKMYNWVKNVLFDSQNTGKTFNERRTDNKYLQELKRKFERAYNTVYQSSAGKMYDIITTKDNKRFVKASRQVIQGNDVSNWGKQIKKYINEEIRKGQDVSVYGEDGTLLSITADTAGKATFRNEVRMSDGTTRLLTDNEYKSKLEAESHVDELAQVSKHKNGPVPDTKNHSFAKDGFNYRTAYFEDSDGKYYKITISVGKNGAINTIYNVGQMKEMQKNRSDTSNRGLKGPNGKTANGSITSKYSIPSSDNTVNSQYMQNNEKNSQGLENSSSFSLSKDNQGRTLSKEQQEYFKDSKVRDENDNLIPVPERCQKYAF